MTMAQYVYQVYFKNTDMIIVASIVIAAPMIVMIPFVSKMTRRLAKGDQHLADARSYCHPGTDAAHQDPTDCGGLLDLSGASRLGKRVQRIFLLLIWSFVADAVDYQEYETGRREEGTVYSIYSFVRKLAQAACQGLISVLLAAVGFDTNNVVATTDATALSVLRLSILLPLVGAVLMFLSMMFIYNLDKKKTIELSEALHARRQQESAAADQ